MTKAILLLFTAGLSWVSVGAAVGYVERRGYDLVLYQILLCTVCVVLGLAGWLAAPGSFFPKDGAPALTWTLVVAGTFLCGVFNYLMIAMMGKAMKRGPNAIVWAIIQSGLIYPFLMGWLIFGEEMGPRRLCGISLIVASVFLYAKDNPGGSPSAAAANGEDARKCVPPAAPLRQWLPAALLGMLFCGINQCGGNLPSYLEGGKEFSGTFRTFSVYFGLLLAGLAHVAVLRVRGARLPPPKAGEWRGLALWAGGVGVLLFLVWKFLQFPGLDRLESLGAGSMGYPVMVAACIAGFLPYGIFVLHERIDSRQALGVILGLAGIFLGCI
jgi:drug/metabolite transporter (DMT)-like permease